MPGRAFHLEARSPAPHIAVSVTAGEGQNPTRDPSVPGAAPPSAGITQHVPPSGAQHPLQPSALSPHRCHMQHSYQPLLAMLCPPGAGSPKRSGPISLLSTQPPRWGQLRPFPALYHLLPMPASRQGAIPHHPDGHQPTPQRYGMATGRRSSAAPTPTRSHSVPKEQRLPTRQQWGAPPPCAAGCWARHGYGTAQIRKRGRKAGEGRPRANPRLQGLPLAGPGHGTAAALQLTRADRLPMAIPDVDKRVAGGH